MICTKCGNQCSDTDEKCSKCGSMLNDFVFETNEENIIGKTNAKDELIDNEDDRFDMLLDDISNKLINDVINPEIKEEDKLSVDDMMDTIIGSETKANTDTANDTEYGLDEDAVDKMFLETEKEISQSNPYDDLLKKSEEDILVDDVTDNDVLQNNTIDENGISEYVNDDLNFISETESDVLFSDESQFKKSEDIARQNKARKLTVFAVIAMIACVALSYFFISRRAILDKFESALYKGNYSEAVELYEDVQGSKKDNADKMIVDKIDDIFKRYSNGTIKSDEAVKELGELNKINSKAKSTIGESISDFNHIIASETFFKRAGEYYDKEDYENAIINYYSVVEADYNYKNAQKMLKKAVEEYKKIEIEKAEEFIAQQDYDSAIDLMKKCHELVQSDEDINNKYKEYLSAKLSIYIEDILTSADECIEKSDYTGAIKIMHDAIIEYGEDEQLKPKYDEYKEQLMSVVNECISTKKYNRAMSLLDEYLVIATDDEDAKKLADEYRQYADTGLSLNDVEFASTSGKIYKADGEEVYTDCANNVFEDAIELIGYKNLDNQGEIVINNLEYSKIKGSIGYSNYDYFKDGKAILIIKADDKEIYKSETVSAAMEDIDVDLDIAGCSNITISWQPASKNDTAAYGIVLGDFKLMSDSNE